MSDSYIVTLNREKNIIWGKLLVIIGEALAEKRAEIQLWKIQVRAARQQGFQ